MSADKHVAFTGTQRGMQPAQGVAFTELICMLRPDWFHHGNCVGADKDAHDVVRACLPTKIRLHPCNITNKQAECVGDATELVLPPLVRNRVMVDQCPILVATPGEADEVLRSGTWATIRYARAKKRTIYLITPLGDVINGAIK